MNRGILPALLATLIFAFLAWSQPTTLRDYHSLFATTTVWGTTTFDLSIYLDDQEGIRFLEEDSSGNNYVAFRAPATLAGDVTWTLPSADSAGCWRSDGAGTLSLVGCPAGGIAPANASYLVLGLDGTLSDERVLTAGVGTDIVDTGANGTLTLDFDSTEIGTTTWGSGAATTWTFNASAGTDCTFTPGDAEVGFGNCELGLGTATPGASLEIEDVTLPRILIDDGSVVNFRLGGNDDRVQWWGSNADYNGATWNADDVAYRSWIEFFRTDAYASRIEWFTATGANPRTPVSLMSLNATGLLVGDNGATGAVETFHVIGDARIGDESATDSGAALNVSDTDNTYVTVTDPGAGVISLGRDANATIGIDNGYLAVRTGITWNAHPSGVGTERLRVHADGDVSVPGDVIVGAAIGTNPTASLHVVNDGSGDSFLVADTNLGDTTPFVIQSDGDVGIGTTAPGGKLEVVGASSYALFNLDYVRGGSSTNGRFLTQAYSDGTYRQAEYDASDYEWFTSGGTADMVLTAGGNAGIATTVPQALLQVGSAYTTGYPTYRGDVILDRAAGSVTASGGVEFLPDGNGSGYGWRHVPTLNGAASGYDLIFLSRRNTAAWTESVRFADDGNVGIGTTVPGEALSVVGAMNLAPRASPPGTPNSGDIYVDSTPAPDELCFYDGAAWQGISSGTDANCA